MATTQLGRACSALIDRFLLLLIYILLSGCGNVDLNEAVNCFSERFDSVIRWNISITGQDELDGFIDNITSLNDDTDRCIQIILTRSSYDVDIIRILGTKLGTGGGFVMMGVADTPVMIDCVADASGLEDLRNNLKPLADVSLVVLDGLLFTECPVPIVLEEVSTVMVQNCVFM